MTGRWRNRPEGSTWGDSGPGDECGRVNLLTPKCVMAAVAEVREGRTFCLSLPLDYPGGNVRSPHRCPPRLFATERKGRATYNFAVAADRADLTDVVSDDAVLLYTQYSIKWDSLAHVGALFDAEGDEEGLKAHRAGALAGFKVPARVFAIDDLSADGLSLD